MEIHPPEHPIRSWKDFAVQLGTITAGILIALSLEGLLEWRHHRQLVHEAKANITSELQDNKKELEDRLKDYPDTSQQYAKALAVVNDLLAHRKMSVHELKLTWHLAQLNATSWRTAQAIGALSHMEYADVKKYSALYDTQQQYQRLQERTLDDVIASTMMFQGGDFEKMSQQELAADRERLTKTLSSLNVTKQIGEQLRTEYKKVLAEK